MCSTAICALSLSISGPVVFERSVQSELSPPTAMARCSSYYATTKHNENCRRAGRAAHVGSRRILKVLELAEAWQRPEVSRGFENIREIVPRHLVRLTPPRSDDVNNSLRNNAVGDAMMRGG